MKLRPLAPRSGLCRGKIARRPESRPVSVQGGRQAVGGRTLDLGGGCRRLNVGRFQLGVFWGQRKPWGFFRYTKYARTSGGYVDLAINAGPIQFLRRAR